MEEPKDFAQDHSEWQKHLLIDYMEARDLFPHGGNNVTRKTKQFTLTEETCNAWADFLLTHSGTKPQRGRGISSTLTEVAQLLLMAVVAGFNIKEIVEKLKRIMPSDYAIGKLKENLKELEQLL